VGDEQRAVSGCRCRQVFPERPQVSKTGSPHNPESTAIDPPALTSASLDPPLPVLCNREDVDHLGYVRLLKSSSNPSL
jgi:hypothetical protein